MTSWRAVDIRRKKNDFLNKSDMGEEAVKIEIGTTTKKWRQLGNTSPRALEGRWMDM